MMKPTKQREGDQPLPTKNTLPHIHQLVADDVIERMRLGITRYGTPLQPHNGRDVLRDIYEELLDASAYIRQRIWELENPWTKDKEVALIAYLEQQKRFSEKTFGPGPRTQGVIDHIKKELVKIEKEPFDLEEWLDVVILGFDGAWRAGHSPHDIAYGLLKKMGKNEGRKWPDWQGVDTNRAIEHIREG
jgi:hypothetical protein